MCQALKQLGKRFGQGERSIRAQAHALSTKRCEYCDGDTIIVTSHEAAQNVCRAMRALGCWAHAQQVHKPRNDALLLRDVGAVGAVVSRQVCKATCSPNEALRLDVCREESDQ